MSQEYLVEEEFNPVHIYYKEIHADGLNLVGLKYSNLTYSL